MTADQLTTVTATALDALATALDAGHSERFTALLRTMARFHQYSLRNVWLISAQWPTALAWPAGFQTWRSLGRFVRGGDKGIAILAPVGQTAPRRRCRRRVDSCRFSAGVCLRCRPDRRRGIAGHCDDRRGSGAALGRLRGASRVRA